MSQDQADERGNYGSLESLAWHHPGRLTLLLIAACVVVAAFTLPGLPQLLTARLYDWGAKANDNIAAGEWWRLLTSSFLHGGWVHLVLNLYGLFVVGSLVEKILGPARFFTIYIVAALTGSLASYAFNSRLSVGASGAIFGVMGAALVAGLRDPEEWDLLSAKHWKGLMGWAGYSLISGFVTTGIDNAAHLGGLLGGVMMALLVMSRSLTLTLAALCALALVWSGYQAARSEKIHPRLIAYGRGLAATQHGEFAVAEEEYDRAAPFLPALVNRSWIRARGGDFNGGLADVDTVVAELRKPMQQITLSNRALRLFSQDTLEIRTMAQMRRAGLLLALDRDPEAMAAVDEALDSPDEGMYFRARYVRGHLLARLGREEEALADLEQAALDRDSTNRAEAIAATAAVQQKVGPMRTKQLREAAAVRLSRIYTEAELDQIPVLAFCRAGWYNVAAPGGYVELHFILDERGNLDLPSIKVTRVALGGSGPRAVEYIGSCRYRPGLVGGLPVRARWQQILKSEPPVALVRKH